MGIERTKPSTTAIIIIDVQQKLTPAMPDGQMHDLRRAARILLGAADELGAPVLVTEQYPKGLGPTDPAIGAELEALSVRPLAKNTFSCCMDPAFLDALKTTGADAAVVVGMEAHICVFQTVRDLCARGLRVDVAIDGVASRREDHRQAGLSLCEKAGANLTTAETVVFDWMVQSGTDTFKKLSALVR